MMTFTMKAFQEYLKEQVRLADEQLQDAIAHHRAAKAALAAYRAELSNGPQPISEDIIDPQCGKKPPLSMKEAVLLTFSQGQTLKIVDIEKSLRERGYRPSKNYCATIVKRLTAKGSLIKKKRGEYLRPSA